MDTTFMRTWAEIDLDNLTHNYTILREMMPEDCLFLGMCKANSYGHGAVPIAKKLEELGADKLAVACLEEAIELRHGGVTAPIFCLGQTAPQYASALVEYNIIATVGDIETAIALSNIAVEMKKNISIHIKLDTGMTRLGFLWEADRQTEVVDQIATVCTLPNLIPEGLFTHFADADGSKDYTMRQLTAFLEAKELLYQRGIIFSCYHCANSAAMLRYPSTHMDMVRPGLVLYGYYPDNSYGQLDGHRLRPVMRLCSRICSIRTIPKGRAVSYGCTVTLERESRVAVLPIGYGDGYFRSFSDGVAVLIDGRRCLVLGRICMDMCMIDVTDLPHVTTGTVATVYGADGLLESAAHIAKTIPYELLCDVNPRVPRVYTRGTGSA